MAVLKATINIVGIRPILFHRFSVDSISLENRERSGKAGNDPNEWKRTVLMTEENQLFVDSTYIFGCLRDGGKYIKSGRGSIQPKIASTLTVIDEIILLDRFVPSPDKLTQEKGDPVYLDIRSVKNPNTKGRNIRYRIAASPGWRTSFKIAWENTIVSREEMEAAMRSAGAFVGLGDGRNIGFGRFEVEQFEIEEEKCKVKKKK